MTSTVHQEEQGNNSASPASNKVGRPTVYKPEYCEKLIEHMEQGLSFESFGGVIGHHKQTLYEWAAKHEDFGDAKKLGFEKCRLFWEKLGIEGIYSESWHLNGSKSLNSAVYCFNMKNRFGWRDKQPDEDESDLTDKKDRFPAMTKEQAQELLKKRDKKA